MGSVQNQSCHASTLQLWCRDHAMPWPWCERDASNPHLGKAVCWAQGPNLKSVFFWQIRNQIVTYCDIMCFHSIAVRSQSCVVMHTVQKWLYHSKFWMENQLVMLTTSSFSAQILEIQQDFDFLVRGAGISMVGGGFISRLWIASESSSSWMNHDESWWIHFQDPNRNKEEQLGYHQLKIPKSSDKPHVFSKNPRNAQEMVAKLRLLLL